MVLYAQRSRKSGPVSLPLKPKITEKITIKLNLLYRYLAEETAKEITILENHPIADASPILETLHALLDLCRVRQTFIRM